MRDVLRAEFPDAPEEADFNYTFMLLVDLHDPGLLVLPTYRLLSLTPEMQQAYSRVAGASFQRETLRNLNPGLVEETLARHEDEHAFIWYAGHAANVLTCPKSTKDGLPVLDVQVLQDQLIAPVLAADPAASASVERNVRYTHNPPRRWRGLIRMGRKRPSFCAGRRWPMC